MAELSEVVAGWPRLHIGAFDAQDNLLPQRRWEIAPGILLVDVAVLSVALGWRNVPAEFAANMMEGMPEVVFELSTAGN